MSLKIQPVIEARIEYNLRKGEEDGSQFKMLRDHDQIERNGHLWARVILPASDSNKMATIRSFQCQVVLSSNMGIPKINIPCTLFTGLWKRISFTDSDEDDNDDVEEEEEEEKVLNLSTTFITIRITPKREKSIDYWYSIVLNNRDIDFIGDNNLFQSQPLELLRRKRPLSTMMCGRGGGGGGGGGGLRRHGSPNVINRSSSASSIDGYNDSGTTISSPHIRNMYKDLDVSCEPDDENGQSGSSPHLQIPPRPPCIFGYAPQSSKQQLPVGVCVLNAVRTISLCGSQTSMNEMNNMLKKIPSELLIRELTMRS